MMRRRRIQQNRRRFGIPRAQYTAGMRTVRGYQRILSADPAVPVLLQLPKWAGRQILFQDPAGTVPVEAIGDPIGGVRHPLTGEIIAVQETDADRPVWGGVGVGADCGDRDSDLYLTVANASSSVGTAPVSIVADVTSSSTSDDIYYSSFFDEDDNEVAFRMDGREDPPEMSIFQGGPSVPVAQSEGRRVVSVAIDDQFVADMSVYEDGDLIGNASSSLSQEPSSGYQIDIGTWERLSRAWDGTIAAIVLGGGDLERTKIAEILA